MKKYKRLAVYGTLKSSYPLHSWLKNSKFICNDFVKGSLYKMSYPFLLEGNDDIVVEIYDVEESIFNNIKQMEESAGYNTELVTSKSGLNVHVFRYPEKKDYFEKIDKF